jgi:hypothetical protein
VLHFSALSDLIPGAHAEEWQVIRRELCQLDESPKPARGKGAASVPAPDAAHRGAKNYADREDLDSVLGRCQKEGDAIIIGFDGGLAELQNSEWSYLEGRKYKWDWAAGGVGFKLVKNWMLGSVFLEAIATVQNRGGDDRVGQEAEPSAIKPETKTGVKWQGTLKFTDMLALCVRQGDEVLIGFTGGREAFLAKSLNELRARPSYKWDYADNLAGKKRADWLYGADAVHMLRDHHRYAG